MIRIAIPLVKGKRRFHIDKGRPWSVVDHALLAALASGAISVRELAAKANLPRRLVLETIIRLMRAGWVTLEQRQDGIVFHASPAGLSVVELEELPNAPKRLRRWMNFVVDKITGTFYRSREFPFFERHVVLERAQRERLVWMEPREQERFDEPSAIVSTLLDEDERFVGIDPSGDRLVDRYGLVVVRNGSIEGLPERAPDELRQLILRAAASAPPQPAGRASPAVASPRAVPSEAREIAPLCSAVFQLEDLVLGGPEHDNALSSLLRRARYHVVIHSTFISRDRLAAVLPLLHDAAKRGAAIDVLWGEDDEKTGTRSTTSVVSEARAHLSSSGLSAAIRIHPFSTRSHAKILVADNGTPEQLIAVVGSCNWLSSNFQSFDASIRLRDPEMISRVLDQLAELSRGWDGHWTELTGSLASLASRARAFGPPAGARSSMGLVLGPEHSQYVRMARNTAQTRLFVTSHRLGTATRPAVIVPAVAAVRERNIQANVYYGIPTGALGNMDANSLAREAAVDGVSISPVREPRLHAKILAWDDDHLLITSQNWLSADPGEDARRREIGVYVESRGAARSVIGRFEALRVE